MMEQTGSVIPKLMDQSFQGNGQYEGKFRLKLVEQGLINQGIPDYILFRL